MLVSEILRIKGTVLFTTPPDAPVMDAVKVMAQHDIGSLVVMDHGRVVGIVTFAEVLRALAERPDTPWAAESLLDLQLRAKLYDIFSWRGGEYAFAIDGPILPTPSWKLVFEVNDPAHLQQARVGCL